MQKKAGNPPTGYPLGPLTLLLISSDTSLLQLQSTFCRLNLREGGQVKHTHTDAIAVGDHDTKPPVLMSSTNRHGSTRDPLKGSPAGVEDTSRTQELVQLARCSVILPLGEKKQTFYIMTSYLSVTLGLPSFYFILAVNASSHDVMCKQDKVKNRGWRFLQGQQP